MRSRKYLPHLVVGISLLVSIAWPGYPLRLSSLAQSRDDDTVRTLVGRLFELYQRKDIDQLLALWSEKSSFLAANKEALQDEFRAYEKIAVKSFDIRKSQIDGDKTTLHLVTEMEITRAHLAKPVARIEKKNRTIVLVKEGENWKVWQFAAPEEGLAAAIIAAKTDEERKALIEKEPELMTAELVDALISRNHPTFDDRGSYQRVLAINQLALKIAEQTGDQLAIASVLLNAGYIHGVIGMPERSPQLALEYLSKSLKIGVDNGFKEVIAFSLFRPAQIYHLTNDFPQAIPYYQKSLKMFEELGNREILIGGMNNLALIYRATGAYAKALELLLKCLKMSESNLASGADWSRLSRAQLNIGSIFSLQGNREQTLAFNQKAVESAEKALTLGDNSAKVTKANALLATGTDHEYLGNYPLALEYFQKSLKLSEEVAENYKNYLASLIYIEIGNVMQQENNRPQAIANYQESLRLAEKAKDRARISYALLSLSAIYFLQGDYKEAVAASERAATEAERVGQPFRVSEGLVVSAKAYRMLGQPEEARQALVRAIDLTEQLRGQSAGNELDRQRSFENAVTPYQVMVDLEVDQKRFREAFAYAQRAKGRTLLELLQNGRADITKSASQAEREQEQQLNRKIVTINRQLTSEKLKPQSDEKRLAEFEAQLKKARLDFEAFQTALYTSHPELKVQRGEIRPVSFDDAAGLIPDARTALLDFSVTNANVQLFVLTRETSGPAALNTYTVSIEHKLLAEKVERFRRRLANKDYDYQKLSRELYELLLKPAERQLQNKTSLIISPDNILWDLPFQVLQPQEGHYLIEDAAISYAPSLSVLREMQLLPQKRQSQATASILALGNPEIGQRNTELAGLVTMGTELTQLPEAERQVLALGRLYGKALSKVYTGPTAREEVVKQESARYRILHLATHGILNDVSPMYSQIMLSQAPGKSDEDGLLEAWEIMNLNLNTDLVVLSACETARGRVGAGEGVIGLTWALFIAGCPTTVVSQWKVESSSTTALMLEFHQRFKTRFDTPQSAISTAEAIRQASLKLMKDKQYQHPFFWGGFVVVGDGR